MDILSRMTTLATDISKFKGIRIHTRAPHISHLFFADDAMFFFTASTAACQGVATVIDRFCAISGQMLNLRKSFVKFSPNISAGDQQQYKEILRINSALSMGTYLGIPLDIQDNKVQHFTPLLDKITSRISQWNHMDMSQPAKLIIINSILIGAIRHYLSIFRIPATIVKKIYSIIAGFFWKDRFGKGIHWKSRALIQTPRFAGGLGIRNVGLYNHALLMKKVWRIKNHPQLLLSRVYQASRPSSGPQLVRRRCLSWGHRSLLLLKVYLTSTVVGRWEMGRLWALHHISGSRTILRCLKTLLLYPLCID